MTEYDRVTTAVDYLRTRMPAPPRVAVVLGSGLGAFAGGLVGAHVPTEEIPGWARSTVQGHAGQLVMCGNGLAALSGRTHLFEGYTPEQVVFPIRALVRLGVSVFVLTNASGGLDPRFTPGELVLVRDHLNLTGLNPLRGPNDERNGARFPDMTAAYDPSLRTTVQEAATRIGLPPLREGVYAGLLGPTYETPAEIRMLRTLGADLVGMSTVHETIAAVHMGARVVAISCVSNLAAGISAHPLNHEEVLAAGRQAAPTFSKLLSETMNELLR
jgi:purine-nucleoside phosphorylase